MTNMPSYAIGDLQAQAGTQVRGDCLVSLGTSTVALPVVITHGSMPGPVLAVTALWENLLARADYYVDCHCGDLPEVLDPFTSVSPGPDGAISELSRAMADCFDVPRLIVSRLEGSTVSTAALAGIPAVLVEVGGAGRWSQQEADVQRTGLRRVAALAGVLPADQGTRPHLPVFEDAADVISERPGLWFPEVAVGTSVVKGTRLGRLEDAFGDVVQEILAPATGVLVFGLGSLAAAEGDLLAFIAQAVPST